MLKSEEASAAVTTRRAGSLAPLLRRFEFWSIAFLVLSFLFHVVMRYIFHAHGHFSYPYSLNKHDRFYDFTIFTEKFKLFHTAKFFQFGFPINYPAPVCVLFEVFFKFFPPHQLLAFVTFSVLSFAIPAFFFGRAVARRGIAPRRAMLFAAIVLLTSWPTALVIDGGNAEVFVWLALLAAFWAYATGHEWIAAIFFGTAASMKLFPIVFLCLFFRRGRWRYLLAGIATFLAVSLVCLAILGPSIGIAYHGIAHGLDSFKRDYMAQWHTGENGVDHSLFVIYKAIACLVFHHSPQDFMRSLRVYLVLTAVGGVLLFFLRIRFLPLLNQVLCLSIICIYFTAFSGDGTLVHLYYSLAMLFLLAIKAWQDGVEIPGLRYLLSCMVFTLSTESFLIVRHHGNEQRLIGPAHCIGLGFMLVGALRYRLGPPLQMNEDEVQLARPCTRWLRASTQ